MSAIGRWFRLYRFLVSASIRARMQYKFDFIGTSIIQAVMGAYDFLLIAIILWRFRFISGWNVYEIGLLYGVSRMGWGVYRVFCNELDTFERYIVRGDFDSVLIRPWPSLFILLSKNFDISRISWVIQGIGVLIISVCPLMRKGILHWTELIYLALSIVWSSLLFVAIGLATASAAFWIVRIEELQVFTQNAPATAALYPLDIYPKWMKIALLTVIPLGVGNYIPMVYILGKGGSWMNLVWPAIASVASLWVAYLLWHAGETRYHSTGS